MIRIFKNIHTFLLVLAALVINAHMIIPHDHHTADSDIFQEKSCPLSDKGAGHHGGFPVHCHAFTDLASEKAITYVCIKYIQCCDLIPDFMVDYSAGNGQSSLTTFYDFFSLPSYSGIRAHSSLRAPPVLC